MNCKMNKLNVVVDYLDDWATTLDWEILADERIMYKAMFRVGLVVMT
jgi:hypothetical protein